MSILKKYFEEEELSEEQSERLDALEVSLVLLNYAIEERFLDSLYIVLNKELSFTIYKHPVFEIYYNKETKSTNIKTTGQQHYSITSSDKKISKRQQNIREIIDILYKLILKKGKS
ncbi:hypothetical protein D3C76_03620 [compost metagenome]